MFRIQHQYLWGGELDIAHSLLFTQEQEGLPTLASCLPVPLLGSFGSLLFWLFSCPEFIHYPAIPAPYFCPSLSSALSPVAYGPSFPSQVLWPHLPGSVT